MKCFNINEEWDVWIFWFNLTVCGGGMQTRGCKWTPLVKDFMTCVAHLAELHSSSVDGAPNVGFSPMQKDTVSLSKYFQGKNLSHILSNEELTNTHFYLVSETRCSSSLILWKQCEDEVIVTSMEREQFGRSLLVLITKIRQKQLYYCKIIDKNMSTILLLNKAGRMMTLSHAGQEQRNYVMSMLSWDMTGTFARDSHVNSL